MEETDNNALDDDVGDDDSYYEEDEDEGSIDGENNEIDNDGAKNNSTNKKRGRPYKMRRFRSAPGSLQSSSYKTNKSNDQKVGKYKDLELWFNLSEDDFNVPIHTILAPLNEKRKTNYITINKNDGENMFHNEIMCPICLDVLDTTWTVMACLHRFCSDCLQKTLRMDRGPNQSHECPLCRVKLASRRACKPDPAYDEVVSLIVNGSAKRGGSNSNSSSNNNKLISRSDIDKIRQTHLEKVKQFRQVRAVKLASNNHSESRYSKAAQSIGNSATLAGGGSVLNDANTLFVNFSLFPYLKSVSDPKELYKVYSTQCLRTTPYIDSYKAKYQLRKPYLRMSTEAKVADLKDLLVRRLAITGGTTIEVMTYDSNAALMVLDDATTLENICKEVWDKKSELMLIYKFPALLDISTDITRPNNQKASATTGSSSPSKSAKKGDEQLTDEEG